MRAALLAACVAVTGCADAHAVRTARPWDGAETVCKAEGLDTLIGQPASSALGADALARSGARVLRWIPPGTMVSMIYMRDRLNLYLDAAGRVSRVSCS